MLGFVLGALTTGTAVALYARKWRLAIVLGALPAIALVTAIAFLIGCAFRQCGFYI